MGERGELWGVDDVAGLLEHLVVEEDVEGAGAEGRELAEHDVRGDAAEVVALGVGGGAVDVLDTLLEGGAAERPDVLLVVDAVARDGHDCARKGHEVAEDHDVALVGVRAVKAEHLVELAEETRARGLAAEDVKDLADVVAVDRAVVDLGVDEHLRKGRAGRLQDPRLAAVLLGHDAVRDRVDKRDLLLLHAHLCETGQTAQRHARQQRLRDDLEL